MKWTNSIPSNPVSAFDKQLFNRLLWLIGSCLAVPSARQQFTTDSLRRAWSAQGLRRFRHLAQFLRAEPLPDAVRQILDAIGLGRRAGFEIGAQFFN